MNGPLSKVSGPRGVSVASRRKGRVSSLSAPSIGAGQPGGPLSFANGGMTYAALDDARHMQPGMAVPDYLRMHLAGGGKPRRTPQWSEYQGNKDEALMRLPRDVAGNVWPAAKGFMEAPFSWAGMPGWVADILPDEARPEWMNALPNPEQAQSYAPGAEVGNPAYDIGSNTGSIAGPGSGFVGAARQIGRLAPKVAKGAAAVAPGVASTLGYANGRSRNPEALPPFETVNDAQGDPIAQRAIDALVKKVRGYRAPAEAFMDFGQGKQ